ncbi:MAG: hypothetical protein ACK4TF_03575 [Thermodesulfovibrionales bacterium]
MRNKEQLKTSKLSLNLGLFFIAFLSLILLLGINSVYCTERKLTKTHQQKIEKIATILTEELVNRKIKTVILRNFVDLKGRTGPFEQSLTYEFRKALIKVKKGRFKIFTKDAEVIIRGIVIPYAEKDRFDLKIELFKSPAGKDGSEEILFTYTGIFK